MVVGTNQIRKGLSGLCSKEDNERFYTAKCDRLAFEKTHCVQYRENQKEQE